MADRTSSTSSTPSRTTVAPIRVDNATRRSGDHPLEGHFVKVIGGEHEGQVGVFESVVDVEKDGYPSAILVRFRDHTYDHAYAKLALKDVRPADPYKGGR